MVQSRNTLAHGAIFAAAIHALQDDQHRVFAFGVQDVMQLAEAFYKFCSFILQVLWKRLLGLLLRIQTILSWPCLFR